MVVGAIPNFDSFVWISVGLFIVGLIGTMVYERSSSKVTGLITLVIRYGLYFL